MSPFEPLVRIAGTAFPYWLIALAVLSVLSGLIMKRSENKPFFGSALLQGVALCGFFFMVLGTYVQLTSSPVSFVGLLPSSLLFGFLAGSLVSVAAVVFSRSENERVHPAMVIATPVFVSVFIGFFLAFVLSVLPKLLLWQWHLLKHL